jgi:hypothetical protein
MTRHLSAALAAAAVLAGCDILDPGWSKDLGMVIDQPPHMTSLVAPATVTRGVPFQVTASSFGSSSCTRPHSHMVSALQATREIRLYDEEAPATRACTADMRSFPRVITLQFDEPGTAQVLVVGREGGDDEPLKTITRTIVVE